MLESQNYHEILFRRKQITFKKKEMKKYLKVKKDQSEFEIFASIKQTIFERLKEFFNSINTVLEFTLADNNYSHFDELLA